MPQRTCVGMAGSTDVANVFAEAHARVNSNSKTLDVIGWLDDGTGNVDVDGTAKCFNGLSSSADDCF